MISGPCGTLSSPLSSSPYLLRAAKRARPSPVSAAPGRSRLHTRFDVDSWSIFLDFVQLARANVRHRMRKEGGLSRKGRWASGVRVDLYLKSECAFTRFRVLRAAAPPSDPQPSMVALDHVCVSASSCLTSATKRQGSSTMASKLALNVSRAECKTEMTKQAYRRQASLSRARPPLPALIY